MQSPHENFPDLDPRRKKRIARQVRERLSQLRRRLHSDEQVVIELAREPLGSWASRAHQLGGDYGLCHDWLDYWVSFDPRSGDWMTFRDAGHPCASDFLSKHLPFEAPERPHRPACSHAPLPAPAARAPEGGPHSLATRHPMNDSLETSVRRALTEAELRADEPERAIPFLTSAIETLLEASLQMEAELAALRAARKADPATDPTPSLSA